MTHVQGHKVKYSDRNNTAVDFQISLKFGTEFHHVTDDTLQCSKSRRQLMDRLSDSKLGMGVVGKADKDWRGVGTQVVMHSQLTRFLVKATPTIVGEAFIFYL